MKHLGIIGSLERDLPPTYWRIINREVQLRRGESHTVPFTMHCPDADALRTLLRSNDWQSLTALLGDVARSMPAAGVEGLIVCGSALNPLARELGRAAGLPVVNMGHSMAATLEMFRHRSLVLLGTRSTREDAMWADELHRFSLIEPLPKEQKWFVELSNTKPEEDEDGRQAETNRLMTALRKRGARAVVLADPALHRWVNLEESLLPVFDAAEIHAWAAAGWALANEGIMVSAPPCVCRDEDGR